jgi:carbon storage regulator
MLVVSRKAGERLLIGEAIQVTVLAVQGDQVRLGICAPREIPVHREELLLRLRRENQRAAAFTLDHLVAALQHLTSSAPSVAPANISRPEEDAVPTGKSCPLQTAPRPGANLPG